MSRPVFTFLLLVVTAVAAWLRFQHCHEGLPYLHVWDEPQTASTALAMMKSGDFDPHFFHYGSLPIYLCLLVDCLHALSLLGARPGTPGALEAVGNVVINADTGYHWTISHPSFYFWNRALVAAMSAATVWLTGALGRRVLGEGAGLLGAVVLAGASVPILEGATITVDSPMVFFVLLATYQAVRFLQEERPVALLLSLVAVGLAIGCKYTAGIAVIVPWTAAAVAAVAAIRPGRPLPGWVLPSLLLVPAFTFLLTTPYALVDLPAFLDQVGYELRHYKVLGHGESTVTPGWPNLQVQLGAMRDSLGLPSMLLAAAGLPVLFRRDGWALWLYPLVHATYMANTRIDFHRNFLVLYPFVALWVGAAVATFVRRWGAWGPRGRQWDGRVLRGALAVSAAGWLVAAVPAALAARTPETRTQTARLLANGEWQRIGIPTDLRFHALDLDPLRRKRDVREAPLRELLCGSDRDAVVVPVTFRSGADPLAAAALNALLPSVEAALLHGPRGKGEYWLDQPTTDPQLRVVAPTQGSCDEVVVTSAELGGAAPTVLLTKEGEVTAPASLPAGRWSAAWLVRGPAAGGVLPHVRLSVATLDGVRSEAEHGVASGWETRALTFDLANPADVRLSLAFLNDAVVDGVDRNVEIAGAILTRE